MEGCALVMGEREYNIIKLQYASIPYISIYREYSFIKLQYATSILYKDKITMRVHFIYVTAFCFLG